MYRIISKFKYMTALVLVIILSFSMFLTAGAGEVRENGETPVISGLSGFTEIPGYGEFLAINEDNFPDEKFRIYMTSVLKKYGAGVEAAYGTNPMVSFNGAWYYARSGIGAVTALSPDHLSIKSIKGIEYFTSLKQLSVSHNELSALDLSANTALNGLSCAYNKLSSLNVSALSELTLLNVMGNTLTELDISKNKKLAAFACTANAISLLDFRGNTALDPFDASAFNISLQLGTLTVVCDQGSRFEEYCRLYGIPYIYTVMKKRPDFNGNSDNLVVISGEKADLSLAMSRMSGGEKIKKYESSSKDIASINKKGMLKGKKEGTVTVSAYTESGKTVSCSVTVEKAYFSEKKIKSVSGDEVIFAGSYLRGTEYAPDSFLSSDSDVALIEPSTGRITVKGRGNAKITALYGSGNSAAKITFKLKAEIPYLNKTKVYLKTGESVKLKLKGTREKAEFRSSDETVAAVQVSSGEVTGVSKGSATVTAFLNGARYECVVVVV